MQTDNLNLSVIVDLTEVFKLIDNFYNSNIHNNITNVRHYYENDYLNIIMCLFESISEDPSDVFVNMNTSLLNIGYIIDSNETIKYNFINLCNNCKSIIIDIIIRLDFRDITKLDKNFFNFFVKEIRGNSVIIKHLKS